MKINQFKQILLYLAAIGISTLFLFFFVTCIYIGYEAKQLCRDAKRQYSGGQAGTDCTKALVSQLDDNRQSYRSRNQAIWALGQFGDRRALPVLQKYYTGNIPNREPLDKMISQYELKKAINLAGGGLNITIWDWRHNIK